MQAPSTLASWPASILRALSELGVDGRPLARQVGLDAALLDDAETRVPTNAVMRLLDLAVQASGDPAFGLLVARGVRLTTFYALGYAMLASRTLGEALERAVRHRRLISEALELRFDKTGERYCVGIDFSPVVQASHAAVDAAAAITLRTARLLRNDSSLLPTAVLLRRPHPGNVEAYTRCFRAPVLFDCDRTAITFTPAEIETVLPSRNPRLAEQNDAIIVRYLEDHRPATLAQRVRRLLVGALPKGTPSKAEVARELGMSARSLQRHLSAEGTSFKNLLREARLQLARTHTAERQVSVKELAALLGFSNRSAFSRAFKRWTGNSPTRGEPERDCSPAPRSTDGKRP